MCNMNVIYQNDWLKIVWSDTYKNNNQYMFD